MKIVIFQFYFKYYDRNFKDGHHSGRRFDHPARYFRPGPAMMI